MAGFKASCYCQAQRFLLARFSPKLRIQIIWQACASRVPDSHTTELHLGSELLKRQSHLSRAGKPWTETHLIFMQRTPTSRFVQPLINLTLKRLKIGIHYLNETAGTETAMNICLSLPLRSNVSATWKPVYTVKVWFIREHFAGSKRRPISLVNTHLGSVRSVRLMTALFINFHSRMLSKDNSRTISGQKADAEVKQPLAMACNSHS